jgi:hypothetical protein
MISALRKSTIIFLAILQLIAPLVHAHTGEENSDFGLHFHGLEMHGVEHDTLVFHAVSHDFRYEGIIVGIDAGIQNKQVNTVVGSDHSHYLHQQASVFNVAISPFDINFSPQSQQFVCRLSIPSLSPRAPPAQ